jgi:hypothetical protein
MRSSCRLWCVVGRNANPRRGQPASDGCRNFDPKVNAVQARQTIPERSAHGRPSALQVIEAQVALGHDSDAGTLA